MFWASKSPLRVERTVKSNWTQDPSASVRSRHLAPAGHGVRFRENEWQDFDFKKPDMYGDNGGHSGVLEKHSMSMFDRIIPPEFDPSHGEPMKPVQATESRGRKTPPGLL